MFKSSRAFTLLEVLVAIAVIAVLASLSFVGYRQAYLARERMRCLNSLRQWSIALEMYANDNAGVYPRSGDLFNRTPEVGAFMTNYLQITDSVTYSKDRLPLAMCLSGIATYQNDTQFVGWTLYAGMDDPTILRNEYVGVNYSNEQTLKESGLAFIGCVTANQVGSESWIGHGVRYDEASAEKPQGLVAGWPDGHARWVKFEDLIVSSTKFGVYDYYMPKKGLQ
jgi:prepilin-type N-terminal cleavage/methylation domain-containing protein